MLYTAALKFIRDKGTKLILTNGPNIEEAYGNNVLKSLAETIAAPKAEELVKNGNPTTTSVNRDIMMIPGVIYSAIYGKAIGHTKYKYDSLSIVGTSFRAGCKVFFLSLADELVYSATLMNYGVSLIDYNGIFFNRNSDIVFSNQTLNDPIAFSARAANLVCIPGSLLLNIIIARDRQDEDLTNIPWFIYIYSGAKQEWISKVIFGTIARAIVPDQIGQILKDIKKSSVITKSYYMVDDLKNQAVGYFFDIEAPNTEDKLWTQVAKIYNETDNKNAFFASLALLSYDFSSKLISEIIIAFIMIPVGRIAYDIATAYAAKTPIMIMVPEIVNLYSLFSSREFLAAYSANVGIKILPELGNVALDLIKNNPTTVALIGLGTIIIYESKNFLIPYSIEIGESIYSNFKYYANKAMEYRFSKLNYISGEVFEYAKQFEFIIIASNFLSALSIQLETVHSYYSFNELNNELIASVFEIEQPNSSDPIWDKIGKMYDITNSKNAFLASSALLVSKAIDFGLTTAIAYSAIANPMLFMLITEVVFVSNTVPEDIEQCIEEPHLIGLIETQQCFSNVA